MSKSRILVQLDPDPQASSFDAVVALDAKVDHLLQYSQVTAAQVRALVHGAIFTRGGDDLSRTAIFVGGADVAAGEALLAAVQQSFVGPLRVSVMLDANGANTTAAAAVQAAARHVKLPETSALVLAATGPVGQRVVRLLAGAGARVRIASRSLDRSQQVLERIAGIANGGQLEAAATGSPAELATALQGVHVVLACGAAGVELLPESTWRSVSGLAVAIDLNAVPPVGIAGVKVQDCGTDRGGVACYGAIGVGGAKMKIHREAIKTLFRSNDAVLDAEQIFAIARELDD